MHTLCTYFDSKYLDRGLLMWRSLRSVMPDARLVVCCLDDDVFQVLSGIGAGGLVPIKLDDVEGHYPELLDVKPTRSRVEYYFTLTPSITRHVFDAFPDIDRVTYVDGDLFFYTSPAALFAEMDRSSGNVAIIGHRFPPRLTHLREYGTFNVGWVSFKRTAEGLRCLEDWQRRCIDWCYDRLEDGRFADQKYLDAWPSNFEGVVVLQHPGANVAVWNLEPGTIKMTAGGLRILDQPLIFYHFHGLSQLSRCAFTTAVRGFATSLDDDMRRHIYGPYMRRLRKLQKKLRRKNVEPLIRFKYSDDDLAYAAAHPDHGVFVYSLWNWAVPITDPTRSGSALRRELRQFLRARFFPGTSV